MKSKLCSVLVVLCIAVLSATAAHAADNDMRLVDKEAKVISGAEWAGGEPGLLRFNIRVRDLCSPVSSGSASKPVPCSDWRRLLPQDAASEAVLLADGTSAATALLVQVFGVWTPAGSVEPRTLALKFADGPWVLSADKVMASSADPLTSGAFSLSRISWSGSAEALFAVSGDQVKGMHRLVLSSSGTRAEPRPDASQEVVESQAPADYAASTALKHRKKRFSSEVEYDWQKGTGLMTAAFVAQGISLSTTFASIFVVEIMYFNWIIHAITIPFAPMGVGGFALRYGSSSANERLRWTGIGLLEAAAFAAVVGGVNLAAHSSPRGRTSEGAIFGYPGTISHFGASIAFVIAGGVCVGVAKAKARRQGKSQSRRSPAKSTHRGFVMPTIAPRPGGVSLGLTGVF